jgi:cellobiose phosphorylase
MNDLQPHSFRLPLEDELGLHRLTSAAGIEIAVLPNGCVFAIEHRQDSGHVLINQSLGSPLGSGIGRVLLRMGGEWKPLEIAGPGAKGRIGMADDRFVWDGETDGVRHRVTLWLHAREPVWFWRVEVENGRAEPFDCDAVLIQDLGLGERSFILSNEAFASQYIDHRIGQHQRFGPVVMSRQNLAQFGRNPWVAHGCLDGAASFATDALQLFGPAFREAGELACGFGSDLPGVKLQHEAACVGVQSRRMSLAPGEKAALTFFAVYEGNHHDASGDADLARLDAAEAAARDFEARDIALAEAQRSILQDAVPLAGLPLETDIIARDYPERMHEEWRDGTLLSFFAPDGPHNRHIVLGAKERLMRRRHGAILRSGGSMLPDERTLSATCWMHGVFAAQLTIGNTALHKTFSVARDPYNITRAGGLRILADRGGWRLLTTPSLFEMGLNDCRWLYRFEDGAICVHAIASPEDAAMQWHVTATGKPCRFLIFGHLTMGEHEFRHAAFVEVDEAARRISFRPSPEGLWGEHYAHALHHLVVSTPDAVEALGSGALLFEDAAPHSADAYAAIRTKPIHSVSFAFVGALDDPRHAAMLADKYAGGVSASEALAKASAFWSGVARNTRFSRDTPASAALDTVFPWLAHDAMVHLSVPRGLEQYTAAAWGVRDVCQGPVEFLLPLGHHDAVRDILRIVFAQQFETTGDWPQWFMHDPYNTIRDRESRDDVLIWPLKALCDYLEATGDMAFLDEPVAWTKDDFQKTSGKDPISAHVDRLLATARAQSIPGTHLIRYGLGDWNDSLQPADPAMREWMVSSWTAALLYQQMARYASILLGLRKTSQADDLGDHSVQIREDFQRWLMPDGTVAGYALFKPAGGEPDWLLHPRDRRTGVSYSLIAITQTIVAGLLTADQAQHHLQLIREHLLFPDGARLMDKPVKYSGGLEINFQRAESASFFGREIGLMYTHAHLRYCEALGILGEIDALRAGLGVASPISVTEDLPNASLRQRNAYFTSSDAAFVDRDQASAEWARVRDQTVAVDGGWRVYSSGPGIFTKLALRHFSG